MKVAWKRKLQICFLRVFRDFRGCFLSVLRNLSRCFKKVSCCMALIAALEQKEGLLTTLILQFLIFFREGVKNTDYLGVVSKKKKINGIFH